MGILETKTAKQSAKILKDFKKCEVFLH